MHGSRWTLNRLADHISAALFSQQALHSQQEQPNQQESPRRVILAYSGGADSTALLMGLLNVARRASGLSSSMLASRDQVPSRGIPKHRAPTLQNKPAGLSSLPANIEILAVHVDHQLDPESAQRATRARIIAENLLNGDQRQPEQNQPAVRHRFVHLTPKACATAKSAPTEGVATTSHGIEADARAVRYALLEEQRTKARADLVLTAHHDGDQLETLILRLRQGTGIRGLTGVRWQRKKILRPLLGTPQRSGPLAPDLASLLRHHSVPWIEDPTNLHLNLQRNLVRHQVLPTILARETSTARAAERDWCDKAQSLATTALRCVHRLDRRLEELLTLERKGTESVSLDFERWLELPELVQDMALHCLHRKLDLHYGPTRAARSELRRQIAKAMQPSRASVRCSYVVSAIGCACGGGWSWRVRKASPQARLTPRLFLERSTASQTT